MPTISTVISAAIIVAVLIILVKALIYFHNRQKRKAANEFLEQYRQALKNNNLSFSSPELLKDAVIGLDELHRKLLILKLVDDNKYDSRLIDLDLVKNCTIRKSNYNAYAKGYEKNRADVFVEQIALELEFFNEKESVEIIFYKHIDNHITTMHALEEKAKRWEAIISNVLLSKLRLIT